MNNKHFALVLIILIGIGLFALPSTMSLFAGQHSFINIDATGNQVPCQKCHGDVKAELESGTVHRDFKCEYCHRIAAGASSGDNAYGSITYKNGNDSRVLLLTMMDMEAKNFPATILVGDTLTTAKARPAYNGNPTSAIGALSNCLEAKNVLTACDNPTVVLSAPIKSSWKEVATMNGLTGLPIDTNTVTQNSGLDLGIATIFTYSVSSGATNINPTTATVNLTGAGSKSVNPGSEYHAASLVSCLECHGGEEPMGHYSRVVDGTAGAADCSNCHYGSGSALTGEGGKKMTTFAAGGFGLTESAGDTGNKEAHMAWITTDDGIGTYEYGANNDACVACHTHVAVDITYNKKTTIVMEVTQGNDGDYTLNTVVSGGATKTYSDPSQH